MPVIEYKLIRTKEGNEVPSFVKDGGHWRNPSDFSLVGWLEEGPRKYWVPDTIIELGEPDFTERLLQMHAVNPFVADVGNPSEEDPVYMDSDAVISMASSWYTTFVKANS